MLEIFDETLGDNVVPRLYTPERIIQGPFMDAFTHVGQLPLLRRMAGSCLKGESFWKADDQVGNMSADQPLRQLT